MKEAVARAVATGEEGMVVEERVGEKAAVARGVHGGEQAVVAREVGMEVAARAAAKGLAATVGVTVEAGMPGEAMEGAERAEEMVVETAAGKRWGRRGRRRRGKG